MKTIITTHARERYFERTRKKYKHIRECHHTSNCAVCKELAIIAQRDIVGQEDEIDREILGKLDEATEEKSIVNNTGFMQWYYDKYGYDDVPHFFVHDDLVFITIFKKSRRFIVTCVPAKTHIAGKSAKRPKFKKNKPCSDCQDTPCPECGGVDWRDCTCALSLT